MLLNGNGVVKDTFPLRGKEVAKRLVNMLKKHAK